MFILYIDCYFKTSTRICVMINGQRIIFLLLFVSCIVVYSLVFYMYAVWHATRNKSNKQYRTQYSRCVRDDICEIRCVCVQCTKCEEQKDIIFMFFICIRMLLIIIYSSVDWFGFDYLLFHRICTRNIPMILHFFHVKLMFCRPSKPYSNTHFRIRALRCKGIQSFLGQLWRLIPSKKKL